MTGRNNKRLRNGRAQKEGSQQNLSSAELQQNGSVNNETPVAARSATFTAAAAVSSSLAPASLEENFRRDENEDTEENVNSSTPGIFKQYFLFSF
jgi:hypothetical protein